MTEQEASAVLYGYGRSVPDDLIQFGQALADARSGPYIDGWRYFMEKPEKWGREFAAWSAFAKPLEGDRRFDDFCEALSELERV